jgi:hypothetical protein
MLNKVSIFSRFLKLLNYYNFLISEEVLDKISDKIFVFNQLDKIIDRNKLKIIKDIYLYEYQIYNLIKNEDHNSKLLDIRVNKLKRVYNIIKKNKLDILKANFILNKSNIVIKSNYNWPTFNKIKEENNKNWFSNNSIKNYNTYVKLSLIKGKYFDEIPLDYNMNLLKDLWQNEEVFSGQDIVDTFLEVNNSFKKGKFNLTFEISNSLLLYIVYFDALKIV